MTGEGLKCALSSAGPPASATKVNFVCGFERFSITPDDHPKDDNFLPAPFACYCHQVSKTGGGPYETPKEKAPYKGVKFFADRSAEKALKDEQLAGAEKWCADKGEGAKACLTANPKWDKAKGAGGLLSKTALDDRLKGRVVTGKEYAGCAILTA